MSRGQSNGCVLPVASLTSFLSVKPPPLLSLLHTIIIWPFSTQHGSGCSLSFCPCFNLCETHSLFTQLRPSPVFLHLPRPLCIRSVSPSLPLHLFSVSFVNNPSISNLTASQFSSPTSKAVNFVTAANSQRKDIPQSYADMAVSNLPIGGRFRKRLWVYCSHIDIFSAVMKLLINSRFQ